ncbi:geranylgeranyl reductase family protein [Oculatella sp. FACHB-28]|uniref:geranylgeranyl reductase family protein n=1 Tax=Cyanophyceae TaxID=3028117 RepID=UPI0016898ABA|nr:MULTISPECIES: geranylgeranyl reductase family protein [Cyanophyceae]MBD1870213.1 geranylgeranyl reductase family protein [Cyanobacteria bacterium FACHB-471]MBD1999823.1 geranylgeranyl reductase family protein [Leptolyngbya sp. FACHB-541]MBD2058896.1 geranylgeranyl reductase family protein [Oculatella sp. FACHB-28]MBD2071024.1 geranylgeranyl reductase family protein [Leptolyngbya sp. FACHB-671]
MFDCIIVGAGPAGGTAAYHLAKRGRSVLVLEKASLPRYKPCGGGVSPQVAEWFDFDFSPAISIKVNAIRYTWKMGDPVEAKLKDSEPIWMVRRDVFDHFLVQQAQKQGAELRDNTEVTGIEFKSDHWQVNTANGPVTGRYVIAADGAKGSMAKWLGFKDRKRRFAGALEAEAAANVKDPESAHFEFGMVKNGYIWNFPKADGYSIGVGTFRGGEQQDFKAILTEYATLFGIDLKTTQQYGHPLCLWDGNQKLHTQNALLAGEAACVVDPFTAEGIRPSIFTGVKAAEAIDGAIAGDKNALERYTQVISDEWGADMVWAQRLAGIFYRAPGIGYRVGVKRPSATERMVKILCGELRYADVANRAMKRLGAGLIPGMG